MAGAQPDPAQLAALAARALTAGSAKGGGSGLARGDDLAEEEGAVAQQIDQWLRNTSGSAGLSSPPSGASAEGGTLRVSEALKAGEVDLIVALTEGLVADIAQGSDLRLLDVLRRSDLKIDPHVMMDTFKDYFGPNSHQDLMKAFKGGAGGSNKEKKQA